MAVRVVRITGRNLISPAFRIASFSGVPCCLSWFVKSTRSIEFFISIPINATKPIAAAKDTSLAVVAPGIAEALFATALGLAAAIPAVVAFNQISVGLGRSAEQAGTSITSLAKTMSRGQSEGTVRLEEVG